MGFGFDDSGLAPLVTAAAILMIVLTVSFYWKYKKIMSKHYWLGILSVKIFSIITIAVLLLNPYHTVKHPDTRQYSLVVLLDLTQSMNIKDCDDKTRMEILKELHDPNGKFRQTVLSKYPNYQVVVFAGDHLQEIDAGQSFDVLPGNTDIDLALNKVFELNKHQNIGAVLLISDGIDNKGLSLIEGADKYREKGIPIHCIGIGDYRELTELSVEWTKFPEKIEKSKPFKMNAVVRRSATDKESFQVNLYKNGIRH